MRRNIIICFSVVVVLNLGVAIGEQSTGGTDIKALFEEKYNAWKEYMTSGSGRFMSTMGTSTPQFQEIIELGVPALPYIFEKMKDDSVMFFVTEKIIKKKFHPIRTGEDPNNRRWSVEEFPGINNVEKIHWDKLWLRWWKEDANKTPQQFESLYGDWKKLKEEAKETEAKEKYQRMTDLGIFALPSMMEKIKHGNTELIPMVSELTEGKVDKNAKKSDCLAWWQKNKQKWLMPSVQPASTQDVNKPNSLGHS
jgi:hypothetical protein